MNYCTNIIDFPGQWRVCAYALQGVDPYLQMGVEPPLIEDIGVIPNGWGTSPWGLILGNVFYLGFLPVRNAFMYFLILNLIIVFVTMIIFVIETRKISKKLSFFTLILILTAPSFFLAMLTAGNASGIICCLMLICYVLSEKYPLLAGILLGLAMVKPQIALALCFLFVLQKKFKILIVASVIDILSWLIAAFLVSTSPLTLLDEMLHANIGKGDQFSGIFTLLFNDVNVSMICSMIAGLIFIYTLNYFLKDKFNDSPEEIFLMYPVCMAAQFWSYSYRSEFVILLLPIIICTHIMICSKDFIKKIFYFCTIIYLNYSFIFWLIIARFMDRDKTLPEFALYLINSAEIFTYNHEYDMILRTIFEIGVIIIGILICRHFNNSERNF